MVGALKAQRPTMKLLSLSEMEPLRAACITHTHMHAGVCIIEIFGRWGSYVLFSFSCSILPSSCLVTWSDNAFAVSRFLSVDSTFLNIKAIELQVGPNQQCK